MARQRDATAGFFGPGPPGGLGSLGRWTPALALLCSAAVTACSSSRRVTPEADTPECDAAVCFFLLDSLPGWRPLVGERGITPGCNPTGVRVGQCPDGFSCVEAPDAAAPFTATGLCVPEGDPPSSVAFVFDVARPEDEGAHEVRLHFTLNGGPWPRSDSPVPRSVGSMIVQDVLGGPRPRHGISTGPEPVVLALDEGTYRVEISLSDWATRVPRAWRRGRLVVRGDGEAEAPFEAGWIEAPEGAVASTTALGDASWFGRAVLSLEPDTYGVTTLHEWRNAGRGRTRATTSESIVLGAGDTHRLGSPLSATQVRGVARTGGDGAPGSSGFILELVGDGFESTVGVGEEPGGAFEVTVPEGSLEADVLVDLCVRGCLGPTMHLGRRSLEDSLEIDLADPGVPVVFDHDLERPIVDVQLSARAEVALRVGDEQVWLAPGRAYDFSVETDLWRANSVVEDWQVPASPWTTVRLDPSLAPVFVTIVPEGPHASALAGGLAAGRYEVRLEAVEPPASWARLVEAGDGELRGEAPLGVYRAWLRAPYRPGENPGAPVGETLLGEVSVTEAGAPVRVTFPVAPVLTAFRLTAGGSSFGRLTEGADRGLVNLTSAHGGALHASYVLQDGAADLAFLVLPGTYGFDYECTASLACSAVLGLAPGGITSLIASIELASTR